MRNFAKPAQKKRESFSIITRGYVNAQLSAGSGVKRRLGKAYMHVGFRLRLETRLALEHYYSLLVVFNIRCLCLADTRGKLFHGDHTAGVFGSSLLACLGRIFVRLRKKMLLGTLVRIAMCVHTGMNGW